MHSQIEQIEKLGRLIKFMKENYPDALAELNLPTITIIGH